MYWQTIEKYLFSLKYHYSLKYLFSLILTSNLVIIRILSDIITC